MESHRTIENINHVINFGARINAKSKVLEKDKFDDWCELHFGYSAQYLDKYMLIARHEKRARAIFQKQSLLSINGLTKAIKKRNMMYLGIDVNYICWRGFHATGGMSYNNEGTGSIHGFLTALLYHSRQFATDAPVFAFDSRKSYRKKHFPGYKDRTSKTTPKEKEERAEVFRQIEICRKIVIPTLGFKNSFMQTGLEGDDILGKLVRDNPHKFVVITGDEDLLQLTDECTWYSPGTKKTINEKTFRRLYGISPIQWRVVKQIAGCNSDKVPGIHMVGNVTAVKYLNGTLGKTTIAYQVIDCEKRAMRRQNGILVNLPHPKTKPMELIEDNFDVNGFLAICDIYNFSKLAERVGEFEIAFS